MAAEKTALKFFPAMYAKAGGEGEGGALTGGAARPAAACGRARAAGWALAAAGAALALALVALVAVRERQTAALRRDVAALAADLEALRAAQRALAQPPPHEHALDVTVYSDLNEEMDASIEDDEELQDSDERLDALVHDEGDDNDYDYTDYDTRGRPEARSSLQQLTADMWTEEGSLPAAPPEHPPLPSHADAAESKPLRAARAARGARARRSVRGGGPPAAPRDLFKGVRQRLMKHPNIAVGQESVRAPAPPARTPRDADDAEGTRRPFVAAHFHGNTSHLSLGVDEHYRGNGLVRTPHEEAHSVWWPAEWTAAAARPRPTLAGRGRIHVHHSGIYLVYVQVYYFDVHDTVGWVLHRTNADWEGRDAVLQCTHAAPSAERLDKPNSCFSAAALLLRAGDRLVVRNTGGERHALMHPEKSFVGLVKLADAEPALDPDDIEM